ncbi:MAG: hypothetical protein LBB76_07235 [Azoarcus sp.]|jgi:4-amino-4-deoxy-L-arabinose transferase-like glycosyltransferase|nr:hypothetical protein [Azoarcus sp.]
MFHSPQAISQTQSIFQRRLYGSVGLMLLVGFYLLSGLGHEPWRGDDARYFGPVYAMLQGDGWLFPQIGGQPFADFPPLYYWCAALLAWLTQGVLAAHDGARLASAVFTALTVWWVARAAEHLHGRPARTPAALFTLGSLGLVLHAHETQPLIALMAMVALVLEGIARTPARPLNGCLRAGLGCALAGLAGGLGGWLLTLPLFAIIMIACPECRNPRASASLLIGLVLAAVLGGLWPLVIHLNAPELFAAWAHGQWLTAREFKPGDIITLVELLSWFLWPLWPIALWALWHKRRQLLQLRWLLPLASAMIAIILLIAKADDSPPTALQVLPAMALLAAGGVPTLRRGAANAFDWFGATTFGVFAILVWIAWTAQVFAWPPGLARHIARVAPTFVMVDSITPALAGSFICALWFALAWRLPRGPGRAAANWAMGMTMLWCLAVTLLMPWFDHSRTYRPMADALREALAPHAGECVASAKLPDPVRSMLDYYLGLRPHDRATPCRLLLVHADRKNAPPSLPEWETVWAFSRGGGKQYEALYLYRRLDRD